MISNLDTLVCCRNLYKTTFHKDPPPEVYWNELNVPFGIYALNSCYKLDKSSNSTCYSKDLFILGSSSDGYGNETVYLYKQSEKNKICNVTEQDSTTTLVMISPWGCLQLSKSSCILIGSYLLDVFLYEVPLSNTLYDVCAFQKVLHSCYLYFMKRYSETLDTIKSNVPEIVFSFKDKKVVVVESEKTGELSLVPTSKLMFLKHEWQEQRYSLSVKFYTDVMKLFLSSVMFYPTSKYVQDLLLL